MNIVIFCLYSSLGFGASTNGNTGLNFNSPAQACGTNEVWTSCSSSSCFEHECGKTPPTLCTRDCKKGCKCANGYARRQGQCILESTCPQNGPQSCKEGEEWTECSSSNCFERQCNKTPSEVCLMDCRMGCKCSPGFSRLSGQCVNDTLCPSVAPSSPATTLRLITTTASSGSTSASASAASASTSASTSSPVTTTTAPVAPQQRFIPMPPPPPPTSSSQRPSPPPSASNFRPLNFNSAPTPCPANEEYTGCSSSSCFEARCGVKPSNVCTRDCRRGCKCSAGFARRGLQCVLESACPPDQTTTARSLNLTTPKPSPSTKSAPTTTTSPRPTTTSSASASAVSATPTNVVVGSTSQRSSPSSASMTNTVLPAPFTPPPSPPPVQKAPLTPIPSSPVTPSAPVPSFAPANPSPFDDFFGTSSFSSSFTVPSSTTTTPLPPPSPPTVVDSVSQFLTGAFAAIADMDFEGNRTLYVSGHKGNCTTGTGMCLLTRYDERVPFSGKVKTIAGFTYEPGNLFTLFVRAHNSPLTHAIAYDLIRIVSKTPQARVRRPRSDSTDGD